MTNFIWAGHRPLGRVAVVTTRAQSKETDTLPLVRARAWEFVEIAAIAAVMLVLYVLADSGLIEDLLLKLGMVEGLFR